MNGHTMNEWVTWRADFSSPLLPISVVFPGNPSHTTHTEENQVALKPLGFYYCPQDVVMVVVVVVVVVMVVAVVVLMAVAAHIV